MSNFVSTYSTQCGVKASELAPEFPSVYYPTPDKYITVQASGGHPARDYPLYSEVCNLLRQKLNKLNIEILQLGSENDTRINFTTDLRGKTNIRQTAYIIENALLHTGVDSSLSHLAGIKNIPLVTLCPNSHPNAIMPHYCNAEKTIAIVSDLNGNKFSYDPNDKTISTIKPETVANAVLRLLSIEHNVSVETISIGKHFNKQKVIDFVPDFWVNENDILKKSKLVCRADLNYNLDFIYHFFTLYGGTLVVDKEVPLDLVLKCKSRISEMMIRLDNGYDKDYIKGIHKSGIPYILSYNGADDDLKNIKLDLFDYNPVYKQVFTQKPVDNSRLVCDSIFRTNRSVISKAQLYASEYHWKEGIGYSGEPLKIGDALDDEDFWKNSDHYYLYNLK